MRKVLSLVVSVAVTTMLLGSAHADTNRDDIRAYVTNSFDKVHWGQELDHFEYLKFIAAVLLGPEAVAAYLETLLAKVAADVGTVTNKDAAALLRGEKATLFNGKVVIGTVAYNHWTTVTVPVLPPFLQFDQKIPLPNTHQLYAGINPKGGPPPPAPTAPKFQLFTGDMDGDKRADRILLSPAGEWYVLTASGENGVPGIPWGSKVPGWPGNGRYFIADFDGDHKADRAYLRAGDTDSDGHWFVVGASGGPGVPNIPWGSTMAPGIPASGRYFIADFDGDGKADRAFLRRQDATHPDGVWFVVGASGGPGVAGIPWGAAMAPGMPADGRYFVADFDGDGKADRAFLRSEGTDPEGRWFVVVTSGGPGTPGIGWGAKMAPGMPATGRYFIADFDGDGKADRAFVRQGDGADTADHWFVVCSANGSGGVPGIPWGAPMAPGIPASGLFMVADFDADGRADRAYVRESDASWFVVSSLSGAAGVLGIPWGSWPNGWPRPSSIVTSAQ